MMWISILRPRPAAASLHRFPPERRRLCGRVRIGGDLLLLLWILGLGCLSTGLFAGGNRIYETQDIYHKKEFRIPMRDGTKLYTAVYLPKDTSRKYPILMNRSPYGCAPYGEDNYRRILGPSELFHERHYIFVYQDVRGCFQSEGTFVNMRPMRSTQNPPAAFDESTDTHDTIEWLLGHLPNHNGRVGMWGISYPGFYSAAALVDSHPALIAVSPQAPIADWFRGDDFHHNGAFFLPHAFNFLSGFGKVRNGLTTESPAFFRHGTSDGYRFFLQMGPLSQANEKYLRDTVPFWNEVMDHENYDHFWKDRNLLPHLKDTRPAVMTVGGWFDAEDLFGPLQIYRTIEQADSARRNSLIMGPWSHGGWAQGDGDSLGDLHFGTDTADYYRREMELTFFESWLKKDSAPALPEAWIFETGANRWNRFDRWPPTAAAARKLYLQAGGRLSFHPPEEKPSADYSEYISDPNKPVPFLDKIAIGMSIEYMCSDQRFVATRPDVLVFESDPVKHPLKVAGPIRAVLHVSTSGTDSDWIVKLIDVYPEEEADEENDEEKVTNESKPGAQIMIRGDVFRGRFRRSFEQPEPMTPGEPTLVEFTLQDICHTFRAGHKIMVQIQSTWFPLVDRNPQKFVSIRKAQAGDFQKAMQRVYHTRALPTYLEIPLLNAPDTDNQVKARPTGTGIKHMQKPGKE